MATLQASMSGASVASMALAGAFGDVLGIREVFFVAATIVVGGGLVSAVLYRSAPVPVTPTPGPAAETVADMPRPGTRPGLEEALG
jgi:hypothetical protein